MALNNQVHIYSIDTSAFYHDNEMILHRRLNKAYNIRNEIKKRKDKLKKSKTIDTGKQTKQEKLDRQYKNINKIIHSTKNKLYIKFKENKGIIRKLNKEHLNDYNIISVFESSLTRTIGMNKNTLYEDILIVQTYFFDVTEDIIINGFIHDNEKYICFTASAGQIRTKKTVFIKESIWNKYKDTITCGLTLERINKLGGANVNKYLAYLALANSATDPWNNFNIKKSIVVEDFETMVKAEVDFIDDETYEIERKVMDIPIPHTDGCGMMLPRISDKSMMVRLPWIKGLLVPFPFDNFISEKSKETGGYCGIIEDINGVKHDILKEEIEVIFTKSQFKMWKYYNNWQEYVSNYIKHNCKANKCNEETNRFRSAKINYQMLQTLSDIKEDELKEICEKTKNNVKNISSDKNTMLKVLGAVRENDNKNYLQQALEIYPELLNDTHSKQILKQVKKSMVKNARAGKLLVKGKYTFICPDLYAFCEYLFLKEKNPKGLLEHNNVYCKLYENNLDLDCLRSPHLYREHAIRKNIIDDEKDKWFITNGIYTSCHDVISKILQFDVDGDKSLVCAEKTIVDVARRNMEGIFPLYYNMRKAEDVIINQVEIYKGLKSAYTGGNIGEISNNITKIWNSKNIDLDVIKLLCMENNFFID